jgi:hypothetical protein
MHRSHVSQSPFGPTLPYLVALVTLAAGVACSSTLEYPRPEPASDPGPATPVNAAPSTGGTGSTGGPGGTAGQVPVTQPTPPNEGTNPAPITAPGAGGTTPASADAASVADVCEALGSDDDCAACVCGACASELQDCAGTPGCAEILGCVRDNGCDGSDCYCGDVRLTECLRGEGNGPCKAAVLAAPGGKELTIADPSGGPASDAALSVGTCADRDVSCGDVCDIGG